MRLRFTVPLLAVALIAGCTADRVNADGPVEVESQLRGCPEQTGEPARGAALMPGLELL